MWVTMREPMPTWNIALINRRRSRRRKSHRRDTECEKTERRLIGEETSETGGVRVIVIVLLLLHRGVPTNYSPVH